MAPHKQKYQHKLEQQPFVLCLVTVKIINVQVPVLTVDHFLADSPPLSVVLDSNTFHTYFTATVSFLCYFVASVQTVFAAVPVVASGSVQPLWIYFKETCKSLYRLRKKRCGTQVYLFSAEQLLLTLSHHQLRSETADYLQNIESIEPFSDIGFPLALPSVSLTQKSFYFSCSSHKSLLSVAPLSQRVHHSR